MELIQDLPLTWSDERMHVLDVDCWCNPTINGNYLNHNKPAPERERKHVPARL